MTTMTPQAHRFDRRDDTVRELMRKQDRTLMGLTIFFFGFIVATTALIVVAGLVESGMFG